MAQPARLTPKLPLRPHRSTTFASPLPASHSPAFTNEPFASTSNYRVPSGQSSLVDADDTATAAKPKLYFPSLQAIQDHLSARLKRWTLPDELAERICTHKAALVDQSMNHNGRLAFMGEL